MSRYYAEVSDSDVEIKQIAFSAVEKLRLKIKAMSIVRETLAKAVDNSA